MKHRLLLLLSLLFVVGCASNAPQRQSLYVNCSKGQSLLVYELDPKTGGLTEVQRIPLDSVAGPVAISEDRETVYSVIRNKGDQPARVVAFSRDTTTGKLTKIGQTSVPAFPTYLDIDKTDRFAVTASYGSGVVHTFKLAEDRTLVEGPLQTTETTRSAHASLIDPSNRFVYIPHTIPNHIYQFSFEKGYLRPLQPLIVNGGGPPNDPAGPRHYTFHPTLDIIYFVNEINSSVGAYAWDPSNGKIARFQSLTTLPENFTTRNTCADIHITPDGKYLYASNRGHDSLAAYKLDTDGRMAFIDWFETEEMPREFTIDLTGQYLYSLGLRSHKMAAYKIDQATGRLNRIGTYDTPEGPIWVEPVALD